MKTVVTGGSSMIGGAVARRARDEGDIMKSIKGLRNTDEAWWYMIYPSDEVVVWLQKHVIESILHDESIPFVERLKYTTWTDCSFNGEAAYIIFTSKELHLIVKKNSLGKSLNNIIKSEFDWPMSS